MAAGSGQGIGLLRQFVSSRPLTRLRSAVNTLFSKYLFITNVTTAVSLAATGDVINQHYEKLQQLRQKHNFTRTRNQCIQGVIFGTACHFWYIFLDHRLPGHKTGAVLRKLLADQLIMVPIGVPVFLVSLGWLEGRQQSEILEELRTKGPSLLLFEWTFGPATQLVNFCFLPTRFRVLYDSCVCLCFDAYYSYVKYRKQLKEGETTDVTDPR